MVKRGLSYKFAFVFASLLSGCTTAYLSPEGSEVAILKAPTSDCKERGNLKVQGNYFPSADTMKDYLRNEAAEQYGANALVVGSSTSLFITTIATGTAYYCSDQKSLGSRNEAKKRAPSVDSWFVTLSLGTGVSSFLGGNLSPLSSFSGFRSVSGPDLEGNIGFYLNASTRDNFLLGVAVTPVFNLSIPSFSAPANFQLGIFGFSGMKFFDARQAYGWYVRADAGWALGEIYTNSGRAASGTGPGILGELGYSFGGGQVMDSYVDYETNQYGVPYDNRTATKWHFLIYGRLNAAYCLNTEITQLGAGLGFMF